jgi:hypothetical protein
VHRVADPRRAGLLADRRGLANLALGQGLRPANPVTAAGMSAGIDPALALSERIAGPPPRRPS